MWSYLLLLSSLAGSVLDDRGRPVEAAAIVVSSVGAPGASGVSDANGRFRIELQGSGPASVEAHAPGYLVWRESDVDPGKPLAIVLARAEGAVIGIVRDGESLDPIAGALVEIRLSFTGDPENPGFGVIEGESDERGEFRLEGVGKGTYSLSATAPGYGRATRTDASAGEPLELYLFPGTGVYGRIVDEKREPVEGVSVSFGASDPTWYQRGVEASDREGRFALLGLEPGRYRLFLRHRDFAPLTREVEVAKERDVELELELARGVNLTGRLVNEGQEGVAGKVTLRSLDGGGAPEAIRSRMTVDTDAEGFFSLGPLPPGDHVLRAESREYGRTDVEVSVSGRAREEDIGEIPLESGLSIRGRVVDRSGTPIENAVLTAIRASDGMLSAEEDWLEASSDGEGRFVFAGLSEGLYDLVARAPGYGASDRIAAEPGKGAVTIRVMPAGSLRGKVVDPDGRPLASFVARARASDGRGGGSDRAASEQGLFHIEGIREGEYAVEIQAPGFVAEGRSRILVSAGEVTDLGTIRLRKGGSVAGTVVDSSSEPLPGAQITVQAPGSRSYSHQYYNATSDRLGRFRIEGLADGSVRLQAIHPSYAQTELDRIEIDSRSAPAEVEIVMKRGGALEGYVRSRDGTDIAGRTIQVLPNPTAYRGYGEASAQTSVDGFFRFEHLPAGRAEVQLLWTAPPATYTVQRKEVEIEEAETLHVEFVSRRVVVSGRVTRGSTPLSRLSIELWPVNAGMSMVEMGGMAFGPPRAPGPQYLAAVSSEDGYYELLVDEPGEYRMNLSARSVGLPSKTVAIPDVDSFTLDMDFGGATISGRVIDEETEGPIAGAYVNAQSSKPGASGAYVQVGMDGVFELEVEPGEHTLMSNAEGYGKEEKKLTVGEEGLSDVVFAMSRGLRISGRVADAGGRGTAGLRVMAIEDSPDVSSISMMTSINRSVADGNFVLDGLSPGRYNVLAGNELAGFALAFGIAAGREGLEMALRPAGKIDARVVDGEGNPVPGATVGVAAVDGRRVRGVQGRTDAEGRIALAVPRGNVTLKAMLMDGPEALATSAVGGGASVPVEIVLARSHGGPRK